MVPVIERADLGFAMLLNLASVCNAEDKAVLWGFISRYAPEATPATAPMLDSLAGYALNYYRDFVKPTKRYRQPTDQERAALADPPPPRAALPEDARAASFQNEVHPFGKPPRCATPPVWFRAPFTA